MTDFSKVSEEHTAPFFRDETELMRRLVRVFPAFYTIFTIVFTGAITELNESRSQIRKRVSLRTYLILFFHTLVYFKYKLICPGFP
jgi:hypothetical protein